MERPPDTLGDDLREIADQAQLQIEDVLKEHVPAEVIANVQTIVTDMGCKIVARILRRMSQYPNR